MFSFCSQKTLINSQKTTILRKIMAKMRIYKFWNESGTEKEKESMSLKKAVMSVQVDFKDEVIGVEYISKKGKKITSSVKIPMGRKIRQSIALEKKRLARKALLEQRQKERYGS